MARNTHAGKVCSISDLIGAGQSPRLEGRGSPKCCDHELKVRWDLQPRPNTTQRGSTPTNPTRGGPDPAHDPDLSGEHAPSPLPRQPAAGAGTSGRVRHRAPAPLPPTARDSTRASCTRAPSKQKQRRRGGRVAAGGGGARGQRGPGAPPPPLPSTEAAPPPPRAPQAARSGRPGAGGQRAPPCLQPSLLAGYPARKRSPRRRSRSAHPPAAAGTPLGMKPSPRLWGRGRASLPPLSLGPPPTRLRVSPRHDSATHFALSPRRRRFRRPPSRGPCLPATDPRALTDPAPAPTWWDFIPLGPPSPPLPPGGGGGDAATSCQKLSFPPSPLNIPTHPSA